MPKPRRSVRLIWFLGALVIALALAGPTPDPAATQEVREDGALDLPAMALTPADLEDAGLNNYTVGDGNLTPWTNEVDWLTLSLGLERDDVIDAAQEPHRPRSAQTKRPPRGWCGH